MTTQPDIFERLRAPFPPARVSWRVGPVNNEKTRGIALAYIDARDVMDLLDEVCTPAGWQCRYPHANGKTVCEIGIKIADEWIWKADGAGDTEREAEKGALSDAFKRAAVRWGIGRYLYDTDSPWVEIEQRGKSYAIKDSERPKLLRLLEGKKPPAPSTPPQGLRGAMNKLEDTLIAEMEAQTDAASLERWTDANLGRIKTLESAANARFKAAYLTHRNKLKAAA